MTAREVMAAVAGHRFAFGSEFELQAGIEQVLRSRGAQFEAEADLGQHGRIDFLLDGGIGIEVKVAGSPSAVARQVIGYTKSPSVREIVLITARARVDAYLPLQVGGKPIHVVVPCSL